MKTFIHRHTLWGDLQEKRIPTLLEAMKYKIVNEFDLDDFSDFFTSSSVKNITFKPTIDQLKGITGLNLWQYIPNYHTIPED